MQIPFLRPPEKRWECPNCNLTDITREAAPHTRFHVCGGLKGLTAPMVPAGEDCRVQAKIREDYVGKEVVQYDDDNVPIMAVETERADGSTDLAVLAPSVDSTGKAVT